jgi:hypothetical protein
MASRQQQQHEQKQKQQQQQQQQQQQRDASIAGCCAFPVSTSPRMGSAMINMQLSSGGRKKDI